MSTEETCRVTWSFDVFLNDTLGPGERETMTDDQVALRVAQEANKAFVEKGWIYVVTVNGIDYIVDLEDESVARDADHVLALERGLVKR